MKKKWIMCAILLTVLTTWVIRVIYLNINTETPQIDIYAMNETVDYGDNYFVQSDENRNGYKIQVHKAEIIKFEDFVKRYNLTETSMQSSINDNNFKPEYVYTLNATIFNEENKGGGIDMFDTLLCTSNVRFRVNEILWSALYPQLKGELTFSLRENTKMDIVFPFAVETEFEQKEVVDKHYLEKKQFYLTLTQYPIKKMIRINR